MVPCGQLRQLASGHGTPGTPTLWPVLTGGAPVLPPTARHLSGERGPSGDALTLSGVQVHPRAPPMRHHCEEPQVAPQVR